MSCSHESDVPGVDRCHCSKCHALSSSEQTLIVEHTILAALRHGDPQPVLDDYGAALKS